MLPGFPPGIFPFWGPFPAVPPPPTAAAAAAAPGAADAPQSSTEAPQAAGNVTLHYLIKLTINIKVFTIPPM